MRRASTVGKGRVLSVFLAANPRPLGIAIICVTLWFGWYPFNFFADNDVIVDAEGGWMLFGMGLQADRHDNRGIAYTGRNVTFANHTGAFFRFILTPKQKPDGLACIFSVHDGGSQPVFVVAQWQEHLALFRRVPTSPKGYREVGLRGLLPIGKTVELAIRTDSEKTEVFADGRLMARYRGFSLLEKTGFTRGQVIIGNNAHGTEPWRGNMRGITVYDQADPNFLADLPVLDHEPVTQKIQVFPRREPALAHLVIPERFVPPAPVFLCSISQKEFSRKSTFTDIALNIIGFLPVSLCFAGVAVNQRWKRRYQFLLIVFLAFLFSLLIESVQVFLPSRNSSQLDLFCNTLGGMLAASLVIVGNHHRKNRS